MNNPSTTPSTFTIASSGEGRWKVLFGDNVAIAADQRPLSNLTYEEALRLTQALNAALAEFGRNNPGNYRD